MNITKIRRTTALSLLVLLLLATTLVGATPIDPPDRDDWGHAFCLTQAVLLAAGAVYGPGSFIVRMPLILAWGLAIGFALATHNLITTQGRASLAAGAILVVFGTAASLIVFSLHRWRTGVSVAIGNGRSGRIAARPAHQLSLQTLMILTAGFAVTGVVARDAITAPPDPFGTERDILVIHAWVGFFPCLAAAPALLMVLRPSWKIVLACGYFVLITLADPLLFGLVGPFVFEDKSFFGPYTWASYREIGWESFQWHAHSFCAVVTYALLARAAGFRMVVPDQSNDKNPNPSAQPETDAGCVQD